MNLTKTQVASLFLLIVAASMARAESEIESRIVRVGLFKNGLAVVDRELELPGPGSWLVSDLPEPVHGTFWIESDAAVKALACRRPSIGSLRKLSPGNMLDALAGCEVEFFFRDGKTPPVRGTVIGLPTDKGPALPAAYAGDPRYLRFAPGSPAAPAFLMVKTGTGTSFFEASAVAAFNVISGEPSVTVQKPALLLEKADPGGGPVKVRMTYLARGISWAPAYRLDLGGAGAMAMAQSAVIRNEMEDLDGALIELISGFPSIEYGHVVSPLSPDCDWASFFNALNSSRQSFAWAASNAVQQQVRYNEPDPSQYGVDLSPVPGGEGVDLHYHSLGKMKILRGESVFVKVVSGKTAFEPVVEWGVPDNRDDYGRLNRGRGNQAEGDRFDGNPWDSILFRNPFSFPMTTAPAAIYSEGSFKGQRTSFWVNPGQETSIRITKALSIRTMNTEHEEEGARQIVYIGGNDFRKTTVQGTIRISNYRGGKVKIYVRRRFSGDLIDAEGSPKTTLLEEGAYSVNPRRELVWVLTLGPGEEIELGYRYALLVDN